MKFSDLTSLPSARHAQLEKVVLARKVGLFLVDEHPPEERRVVIEVAESLARDMSVAVRQTLAFELRRARDLPRDLAERIARDVEDVSSPFLSHTEIFSPEDLAELARELEEHARVAIARRSVVPSIVAVAIAEAGGERSVTFLVRNPGADLSEAGDRVVTRFGGHRALMEHLAKRADLSLVLAHRLLDHISEACRAELVARHGIDVESADKAVSAATGANLVRWVKGASRCALTDYIRQLEERGALTDRLLVDVLRNGGIRLLESLLAHRTGIDIAAIEAVVHTGRPAYLGKLLKKAGMSPKQIKKIAEATIEGLKREDGEA